MLLSMLLPTFFSLVARSLTKLLLLAASDPVMDIFKGNGVSRTLSLELKLCNHASMGKSHSN